MNQIVTWAHADTNVRAAILNGSRADINAKVDFLSDYDVVLYVSDWRMFQESDDWLEHFGSIMVRFPLLPGSTFSKDYLTRLVMFEDGFRIDFQITESRHIAADDFDNGYRVLVDKDGIAELLQAPSYSEFNIKRPSLQEFDELVNEFWWDFTYVPKHLIRDELPYAKYMLDSLLRFTYLHRMIEWHIGAQHQWRVNTGYHGKWFSRYLDAATWSAYKATFVAANLDENWNALFAVGELFTSLARGVASQLGYNYPETLAKRITEYAQQLKKLSLKRSQNSSPDNDRDME